jgi:hypothetical protein
MWYRISTNWNIFRFIRLMLGLMIVIQSIQFKEYWFILVGGLFAVLALLDMGCVSGNCAAPIYRRSTQKPEEITYEEVDGQ